MIKDLNFIINRISYFCEICLNLFSKQLLINRRIFNADKKFHNLKDFKVYYVKMIE
jgi:hypothetical protein